MDKRNECSKKAIRKALIRLSRLKPYTEISVRELCREAKGSRSTFYNNYRFFNDVVVEMSEAFMEKLRGKRLTREFFDSLRDNGDELHLLLESGVFGREFSLYLRKIVQEELAARQQSEPEDISVNVVTLIPCLRYPRRAAESPGHSRRPTDQRGGLPQRHRHADGDH